MGCCVATIKHVIQWFLRWLEKKYTLYLVELLYEQKVYKYANHSNRIKLNKLYINRTLAKAKKKWLPQQEIIV